ncbi:class I SAM-dependent DNA methyltransferase [Pseudohongiella sp.]|uniref:Methyltransferase domain-containing protein n=2 Tax=root TaxID=1 RepID=A0A0F9YKU4_9ZZZZ|nr:class I SAM-dependent methyltransferase [Pseudohongiella sp.]
MSDTGNQKTATPAAKQIGNGALYADLASYYDQFCAQVDYAGQCAFAARVFDGFARSGARDYLDLACGTGQHLQEMTRLGFVPTGLDNSPAMLAQARARCPQAQLLLCDLAAFDQVAGFDLITCFLYSIHYSHPLSHFTETLKRAWQALKPGGVFVFNAVDANGARRQHNVVTREQTVDGELIFTSGWHYRGQGEVLDLHLCIRRETGDTTQTWHDHHTMTAITLPELEQMLLAHGFEPILLEHDYERLTPWTGESFNAIVVATKPA